MADFIEREVAAGAYGSASDVVGEGLRLLAGQRDAAAEQLEILRFEVGLGLEGVRLGRISDLTVTDILAELAADDEQGAFRVDLAAARKGSSSHMIYYLQAPPEAAQSPF